MWPNSILKFYAAFAPLREKKTNIISPRRKVRKGVWGKNKTNIEVLGVLGAFARGKNKYNLAETQSTQRCFGLKNYRSMNFLTSLSSLRERNK
jgi:hypothetical protein